MLNARRPNASPVRPSRRGLLAGAGAIVVAFRLDAKPARAAAGPDLASVKAQPNAFVRIAPDDTVTVVIKHLDMGQGNTTGLATILADELGADWKTVRTEFAPADATLYNNSLMGPIQGTGGSTVKVRTTWDGAGGIGGFFERTFAPKGLGRVYVEMLHRLDGELAEAEQTVVVQHRNWTPTHDG